MSTFFLEEYHDKNAQRSDKTRYALLMGSAMTAMFAGSDTTRAALVSIWYFLCKQPHHAEIIYQELKDVDISDSNVLAALPHFNATIKETLRLAPPTLSGGKRQTGPAGLWVDDIFIPAGTQVFASKFVTHRRKFD
jgi:tryprostatin B 6-hydroxylase